ncbi:MAG TPA: COX15/CtaA family protein [Bryobacteraceae bacterium]|nr:COX15/CtaA family protein [Bryobacteraceae bacterium]
MSTAVLTPPKARTPNFGRYAWGVLAWNVLVVLWGAFVRASGSGAGCGSHWPLCNGAVVPRAPRLETIIEFTHRLMSGAALVAAAGLLVWSVRLFPRGHRVRKAAIASFAFLIVEALLGAGLVLFQFVAGDASVGRAVYLSLHLVNTQFLLAMLALTAWFSIQPERSYGRWPRLPMATLPLAILVSVSGAIAALGDTLFPASSLSEGFRQDLSSGGHFLLRLRIIHPALAIFSAAFFVAVALWMLRGRPPAAMKRIALSVLVLTLAQLCAGAINIALLAPIGMQIFHLLLADLVWIALVLMAVEAAARGQAPVK